MFAGELWYKSNLYLLNIQAFMTYIHVCLCYGSNGAFPYSLEIPEAEAHIICMEYEYDEYVYGHKYTDIVKRRDSIATHTIPLKVKIIECTHQNYSSLNFFK